VAELQHAGIGQLHSSFSLDGRGNTVAAVTAAGRVALLDVALARREAEQAGGAMPLARIDPANLERALQVSIVHLCLCLIAL
jgi:hypothetical protein